MSLETGLCDNCGGTTLRMRLSTYVGGYTQYLCAECAVGLFTEPEEASEDARVLEDALRLLESLREADHYPAYPNPPIKRSLVHSPPLPKGGEPPIAPTAEAFKDAVKNQEEPPPDPTTKAMRKWETRHADVKGQHGAQPDSTLPVAEDPLVELEDREVIQRWCSRDAGACRVVARTWPMGTWCTRCVVLELEKQALSFGAEFKKPEPKPKSLVTFESLIKDVERLCKAVFGAGTDFEPKFDEGSWVDKDSGLPIFSDHYKPHYSFAPYEERYGKKGPS